MSRINRRAFLKASGGAATFGVLAGCTGDGGDGGGDGGDGGDGGSTGGGDEPILIGGLEPISGPFAAWANVHEAGLRFAIEEINADGGVLGRDLDLTVGDTGADAGEADSIFRRMVEQDGVVATTGAVSSDVGVRLSQTATELEVPHILHMAGDDTITDAGPHVYRMGIIPAQQYMQAQGNAFADAGYQSIGAVVADYAWGHAAQEAIEAHFEQDVRIEVAPIQESDFSSYLRQFPDDLEMLINSGHPPGDPDLANQALEIGLDPEVITGASTPEQLMQGALTDAAKERYVHIHNSDPYSDAFAEVAGRFGEARGEQFNTHTAYGYVAGQVIAAGIEEAGEEDPAAVSAAIKEIEIDTLFAQPINYAENGEFAEAVVMYSYTPEGAPEFYQDGTYHYEEVARSDPIPAP